MITASGPVLRTIWDLERPSRPLRFSPGSRKKREGKGDPVRACHLIVVPPSLLFNWEREIEKFYPGLKIYLYQGKERTTSFEGYDLVLTTYGLVNRDIDKLKEIRFDVIVFDEAQAVKNIHADRTGAVRQLKASFKLALTGTPVENHIGEYYSIMDLVLPGTVGGVRSVQTSGPKRIILPFWTPSSAEQGLLS